MRLTRSPTRPVRCYRTLRLALGLIVVLPLALAALVLDRAPAPGSFAAADAAAAAGARDLAVTLEAAAASGRLILREDEMNAALSAAGRLVPGLGGVVDLRPDAAVATLSVGAPHLPAGLWLNLRLGLLASADGLQPGPLRLGRLPLPRALVLPVARHLVDRTLGRGYGAIVIASVERVAVDPPELRIAFAFDPATHAALGEALRERARGLSGVEDAHRIRVHRYHLDREGEGGSLPREGSALPYLRHAVATAHRLGRDAPQAEMRAALYALTLYCGEAAFGRVIGVGSAGSIEGGDNSCARTTLGGRIDLRRHFVVSAGLQAASTAEIAFGTGELKELLDSGEGGTGFSFDDIAANMAGARFAEVLLATPRDGWLDLVARMGSEADLLPALDDLPSGLSETDFRARFGDVGSEAYAAMLRDIAARIEALPFFAAPREG
jgi:hypothetical protein